MTCGYRPRTWVNDTDHFDFTTCSVEGCYNSSAFSKYNAMTLGAEMGTCTEYTIADIVKKRVESINLSQTAVYIFYDLGVTSTMEIEQISAVSTNGDRFNKIVMTSTRTSNSPMISKLSPMVYIVLATDVRIATERFVMWVNQTMNRLTDNLGCVSDVVMVAHNGMCLDHVLLVKPMMV